MSCPNPPSASNTVSNTAVSERRTISAERNRGMGWSLVTPAPRHLAATNPVAVPPRQLFAAHREVLLALKCFRVPPKATTTTHHNLDARKFHKDCVGVLNRSGKRRRPKAFAVHPSNSVA